MPLVIRGADRQPHRINSAGAVEVIDNEGRIAVVITQASSGSVQISTPGSLIFEQYLRQVGGVPSKVFVHEDYATRPLGS